MQNLRGMVSFNGSEPGVNSYWGVGNVIASYFIGAIASYALVVEISDLLLLTRGERERIVGGKDCS